MNEPTTAQLEHGDRQAEQVALLTPFFFSGESTKLVDHLQEIWEEIETPEEFVAFALAMAEMVDDFAEAAGYESPEDRMSWFFRIKQNMRPV